MRTEITLFLVTLALFLIFSIITTHYTLSLDRHNKFRSDSSIDIEDVAKSRPPPQPPSLSKPPPQSLSKLPSPLKQTPIHHLGLLLALKWWDQKATDNKIPYRLDYGSLLGQTRNEQIIPHDTDIDIVVSPASMKTLTNLVKSMNEPAILDQQHHPSLVQMKLKGEKIILLFRARSHHQNFKKIPRIDCNSQIRKSNVDACSFTGPVARVLHIETETFVDIFLTRCKYRSDRISKTWHCRSKTDDCSYCPSSDAVHDSTLQESVRCLLNNVTTWCPPHNRAVRRLERIYGKDWQIPNKKAIYRNDPL